MLEDTFPDSRTCVYGSLLATEGPHPIPSSQVLDLSNRRVPVRLLHLQRRLLRCILQSIGHAGDAVGTERQILLRQEKLLSSSYLK